MEESNDFSSFCSSQNMRQWLEDMFQEEDVPNFDETPKCIEALRNIFIKKEAAEKDAKVMIKAEKNMKDFYNEKAEELQLVTDFIQLNSETCRRVESLASLAEDMNLNEPSLTNFVLAMTEIEDQESAKKEKQLFTSHNMSVYSKKLARIMKTNDKLRKRYKSLKKVADMQRSRDNDIDKSIFYFKKKINEIKGSIQACKRSLEEAGYTDELEIRHSVLVEKAQKLKGLEEQLKTLENKLQAYHSLSPNMAETVKAVESKEEELVQLENELQMLIQEFEAS